MKVLLFGSTSFAAQGLPEVLTAAGHEVWTFDRAAQFTHQGRALRGPYDQLDLAVAQVGSCDVVLVYALVKFRDVAENEQLVTQILDAARKLKPSRLVLISSISVLSSQLPLADEDAPIEEHPWKGEYARVKIATEKLVRARWTESPLLILRPGFIIGEGILDPMVGMGRMLPGGWLLAMGSRLTTIPLIDRNAVHACVANLVGRPSTEEGNKTFMTVMPHAPSREEYLNFMCRRLGRGKGVVYVPSWIWKLGLFTLSLPLSLLKRKSLRLDRTFEHNLGKRDYDCSRTSRELAVDFSLPWQARLQEIEGSQEQATWPGGNNLPQPDRSSRIRRVAYYGMGRIVRQKHLPALRQLGDMEAIAWVDPLPFPSSEFPALPIRSDAGIPEDFTHGVVTAPLHVRTDLQTALPHSLKYLLVEKPLINSAAQLDGLVGWSNGRQVYVLHNYRFKSNVLAFRRHLATHDPGRLIRTTLHFESPSPAHEAVAWMRHEKVHRILLTDYGLHFLDLAWLFFAGDAAINRCDVRQNARGEVESISADLSFAEGSSTILLRQGRHQRQAIIKYNFEHYSVELRFFPDVASCMVGGHGGVDDLMLAARSLGATAVKVGEKLGWQAFRDQSHEKVLDAFLQKDPASTLQELSLQSLTPFYKNLGRLADRAYGESSGQR